MKKLTINKGDRYGRLVILKEVAQHINYTRRFLCQCDCGNELNVLLTSLRSGTTSSCGCLRNEMTAKRSTTHGKYETREYKVWEDMKSRCISKTGKAYKQYGSRGIAVCERWNKFENFYEDMKNGYRDDLTLDRIDNNKGYYKENCRWTTWEVQENNRSNNILVKHNGKWYIPMELLKMTNLSRSTIYYRLESKRKNEMQLI